jgi:hypothetical protein
MWTEQDLLAPERTEEERARERSRRRRLTWGAVAAVGLVALGLAVLTADTSEPPPVTEELEIEVNYVDEQPEDVSPGSRP